MIFTHVFFMQLTTPTRAFRNHTLTPGSVLLSCPPQDPAVAAAAAEEAASGAEDSSEPEQPPTAGCPPPSDPYWPALDQTVTYDHINVKCASVKTGQTAYTWRTFNVSSVKVSPVLRSFLSVFRLFA